MDDGKWNDRLRNDDDTFKNDSFDEKKKKEAEYGKVPLLSGLAGNVKLFNQRKLQKQEFVT